MEVSSTSTTNTRLSCASRLVLVAVMVGLALSVGGTAHASKEGIMQKEGSQRRKP